MLTQIKKRLLHYIKKRPFYTQVLQENDRLATENKALKNQIRKSRNITDYHWFALPGHYYSPLLSEQINVKLPDLDNFEEIGTTLHDININGQQQTKILKNLSEFGHQIPNYEKNSHRYKFANDQFGRTDASFLYAMIRYFKPQQIIEVGSGWSSALMLDTKENHPTDVGQLTFIEPFTERLQSTLKRGDKKHCTIIQREVQDVELKVFQQLNKNDMLFIDDSHVSKSGSDANFLLLKVLPLLKKGVIIHIHDIFYPFEYPKQWLIDEKRNWNEAYLVHAFLLNNRSYEILAWPSYIIAKEGSKNLQQYLPTALDIGSSLWLRKIA